ncbi:DNA cytosine methyltransferase [Arthrobacter sp. PsM3]|uniref:DNA cytosine methyltransferase n=1 Tax=Arthrobacter sp. PsM3 TaxID=3030531 RepID=UPI00263AAE06|nr:DNA cytosine methyltransferase [Arthrobacter sp. PsM3]MDN4644950.1 DNA cytosine methyltransferase [Arthrobacter sp. PsM3]
MSEITVSDFFCGAGGSSTGLSSIPGVVVKLALNHWQRAIESHAYNHPDTDHACADISHIRPEFIPRTTMLWGSPECTNFTGAKGVKREMWEGQNVLFGEPIPDEAAQRSRATMYDIPRFAEIHDYEIIMTENVVEVTAWRPFRGWLQSMHDLGYEHHIISMNSMHAQAFGPGAPQSRDRVYIVFWKKGNRKPDFDRLRPYAECPDHGRVQCIQSWKTPGRAAGKYRQQYSWRCPHSSCRNQILEPAVRPAADAIDWTLTGKRIGDRPKPLAANTLARIASGMQLHKAADNFLIEYYGEGGSRRTDVPFSTFTGRDRHALIVPLRKHGVAKTLDKPLDTITGGGNHHTLIEYTDPLIDDAMFRMIQPHEQMWGMDFPKDYTILGTKTERTLQAGNAVTPPAARDIGTICAESLISA